MMGCPPMDTTRPPGICTGVSPRVCAGPTSIRCAILLPTYTVNSPSKVCCGGVRGMFLNNRVVPLYTARWSYNRLAFLLSEAKDVGMFRFAQHDRTFPVMVLLHFTVTLSEAKHDN